MVEKIQPHVHNGSDCPKIPGSSLMNSPQERLTEAESGTPSSVGTVDLKSTDTVIINNLITRVEELEKALQNLNLLK